MTEKQYQKGDLKVWWIPQVPMRAFHVDVDSVKEAAKMLKVLAEYDQFQLRHNIKPDFCNAGGLVMCTGAGWEDWEDEETGETEPERFLEERHAALK